MVNRNSRPYKQVNAYANELICIFNQFIISEGGMNAFHMVRCSNPSSVSVFLRQGAFMHKPFKCKIWAPGVRNHVINQCFRTSMVQTYFEIDAKDVTFGWAIITFTSFVLL